MVVVKPRDIVFPELPCDGDLHLPYKVHGDDTQYYMDHKDFYRELQNNREEEWREIVAAYEADPNDTFRAWEYLDHHPAFYCLSPKAAKEGIHEKHLDHEHGISRCVDVGMWRVNPANGLVEEEPFRHLNIQNEFYIELGQYPWPGDSAFESSKSYHDVHMNCYGATFEEVLVAAAWRVHEAYGNDRRVVDAPFNEATYAFLKEES